MKKKQIICSPLLIFLFIILFTCSACSFGNVRQESNKDVSEAKQDVSSITPYTIRAIFPGDTPNGMDAILADVEQQLKDTLNVKLEFQFYPWADYPDKVLVKMAAGDNFDLHLNAPWMNMNQLISAKSIQAWNPYLEKFGPDIIKAFPKEMMDANKFDGKIMGIPLGNVLSAGNGFMIRKDLREKYGLQKPKTLDDLGAYFKKVIEKEKGMTPITFNAATYCMGDDTDIANFVFGQNNAQVKIHFDENGKALPVVPIYEDPYFIDWAKHVYQWRQEGLIAKDIMMQKDAKGAFISGKTACANVDLEDEEKLQANIPGGKIETIYMLKEGQKAPSTFQMWNFLCLSTKSKDPEKVTKFYNWIFEDQAHYDLLAYGIKDKNWIDKGNKTFGFPQNVETKSNYNFPRYVLLWNPNFERISTKASEDLKADLAWKNNPKNFVGVNLIGFTPDYKGIRKEIIMVSSVWPETVFAMGAGLLNPDTDMAKIKEKLNDAGYQKIVDEAKLQIANFQSKNR